MSVRALQRVAKRAEHKNEENDAANHSGVILADYGHNPPAQLRDGILQGIVVGDESLGTLL